MEKITIGKNTKIKVDYNEILEFAMWKSEEEQTNLLNGEYQQYIINQINIIARRIEEDNKFIKYYDILDILEDNYNDSKKAMIEEAKKELKDAKQ